MPNLGNTLARTFDFPLPEAQEQAPLQQGEQAPFEVPAPQGLQQVRGTTEDVYNKYYQLKSFASNMWKNYNIDVTKADFTDEFSTKANRLYQESIADLKFTMDKLKTSQEMLSKQASKSNVRLAEGVDLQAQPFTDIYGSAFTQTAMSPQTKAVLEDYQRLFYDKNTKDVANERLAAYSQELTENINRAQSAGRNDLVDQYSRDLQAIQGALYSAEKDKAIAASYARIAAQKKEKEPDYTDLWNVWQETQKGDTSVLEGAQGKWGPLFEPGSVKMNWAKGVIRGNMVTDSRGATKWVDIPLDDIQGGFLPILQEHAESFKDITYDDLMNNTQGIRAKATDPRKLSQRVNPEFFKGMEVVIAGLSSAGKSYTHDEVIDGKRTGEQYKVETTDWIGVTSRLKDLADKGQLQFPGKAGSGVPKGVNIIEVKRNEPWIGKKTFTITISDGVNTEEIKVDPSNAADRKFIRDLVEFNDVTPNDSIVPQFIETQGDSDPAGLGL